MEKLKMWKKKARNGEGEWASGFTGDPKAKTELRKLTNSPGWVAASRKVVSSTKSPTSSRASTPSNVSSTSSTRKIRKKKAEKKEKSPKKFKMVLEKDEEFEVDYVSPDDEVNTEESDSESKGLNSDDSVDEYSLGDMEDDEISSLENGSIYLDDDYSDIEMDEDAPLIELPDSSKDLLIPNNMVLPVLGIYETLRHFRSLLRISPMLFEDFCAALVDEDTNILLTECYVSVLKAILREEDAAGVLFGPPDQKDSMHAALNFLDHMTWPEVVRGYLESIPEHRSMLRIVTDPKFPRVNIEDKIAVLKTLTDIYLASNKIRDQLMTDGVIHYDDHCRACHKLGDLLCCETCPAVYHLACCDPPLTEVPDDEWQCEICVAHKLNGVHNCEPQHEFKGQYLRHEPIGTDRHGNKYWFLARRLIIEGAEEIWYYSTQEQFELVVSLLDADRYEMVLCEALKDVAEEFPKYSKITYELTEEALPDEKTTAYLDALKVRVKRDQEEKRRRLEEEEKKKQEEEEEERKMKEAARKEEMQNELKPTEEKMEIEITKNMTENVIPASNLNSELQPQTGHAPVTTVSHQPSTPPSSATDSQTGTAPTVTPSVEGTTATPSGTTTPVTPSVSGTLLTPSGTSTPVTPSVTSTIVTASGTTTPMKSSVVSAMVTPGGKSTPVTPSGVITPAIPKLLQTPGKNIQVIKLGQNLQSKPISTPTQLKTLFVLNKDGTKTQITLGPAGKLIAPNTGNNQSTNRQILVLNSAKVTLPKVNRELKKLQFTGAGPKTGFLAGQATGHQLRQRTQLNSFIPEITEAKPVVLVPKKELTHAEEAELHFRLGEDKAYRQYVNHYTENTLALNKYQHKEERDRERYLSYKFSMTGEGEFKWMGNILGTETTMLETLRGTLMHLEHQIPLCFMHTRWNKYRNAWGKMVMTCTTPQGFAASLGILEMATRVVVKKSIWKSSHGLPRLKRVTVSEKEEWDKRRKHKTRADEEESNRNAIWCKYPIPIKSTMVWKVRGEEYRMTGYGGWIWISSTRQSKLRPCSSKPYTLVHEHKQGNDTEKKDSSLTFPDIDSDSEKPASTTSTATTKSADLTDDRAVFEALVNEATGQSNDNTIVTSSTSPVMSSSSSVTSSMTTEPSVTSSIQSEPDAMSQQQSHKVMCDNIINSNDVINVSENLLKRTPLYNRKWSASRVDVLLGWRMVQKEKDPPEHATPATGVASVSTIIDNKAGSVAPRTTVMGAKSVTMTTNVKRPTDVTMATSVASSNTSITENDVKKAIAMETKTITTEKNPTDITMPSSVANSDDPKTGSDVTNAVAVETSNVTETVISDSTQMISADIDNDIDVVGATDCDTKLMPQANICSEISDRTDCVDTAQLPNQTLSTNRNDRSHEAPPTSDKTDGVDTSHSDANQTLLSNQNDQPNEAPPTFKSEDSGTDKVPENDTMPGMKEESLEATKADQETGDEMVFKEPEAMVADLPINQGTNLVDPATTNETKNEPSLFEVDAIGTGNDASATTFCVTESHDTDSTSRATSNDFVPPETDIVKTDATSNDAMPQNYSSAMADATSIDAMPQNNSDATSVDAMPQNDSTAMVDVTSVDATAEPVQVPASGTLTIEDSTNLVDSISETIKTTIAGENQNITVVETTITTITKTTSVTKTITSAKVEEPESGASVIGSTGAILTKPSDQVKETKSDALECGTNAMEMDTDTMDCGIETTDNGTDVTDNGTDATPRVDKPAGNVTSELVVSLPKIEVMPSGKGSVTVTQVQRSRLSRMSRARRVIRQTQNGPILASQKVWKLQRYRKTTTTSKKEKTVKLPLPWRFCAGKQKKKSIFRLPASVIRKLAIRGGQYAYRAGFTYGAKWFSGLEQYWLYPCPRPTFSLTWRYKLQNVSTFPSVAHLLRLFWHAIKWDKMTMRPQTDDVVDTITTDEEIITTELLKRKDDLTTGLHSQYYVRRITMPILGPEEEALRAIKPAEGYTPSRKGLRSSRRSSSLRDRPKRDSEPQVRMVWVPEEQVELWQIRQFDTMLKQQQNQVQHKGPQPGSVIQSGMNTFITTPSGGILPTLHNLRSPKVETDLPGPGFSIVKLPLHQNAQLIQKALNPQTPQGFLSTKPLVGRSPVQKIIVQPTSHHFPPYKTGVDKHQTIVRSTPTGTHYIVQAGKLMKPIIIKAGSPVVSAPIPARQNIRLNNDQTFKFQQQPPILPTIHKSPVSIAPRNPPPQQQQTQIKLSTGQLQQLLRVGSAAPVRVSVSLGNGRSGIGQIQLIPPGSQVTPSTGQQLMQTRVGGEVKRFLFTLISESAPTPAAPASPTTPANEVSLHTASLSQRLQQIQRQQLLGRNRNTDMKRLMTDKDPLWGSKPQAPERTPFTSHEIERPKKKPASKLQREEGQRQSVVAQIMKSILDRVERKEEIDMRKRKREEALMKQKEKKEQTEHMKVLTRQTQVLHKHRDHLKQEILKKRAIVEKYLTHAVKNELREDQRKQRRGASGSEMSPPKTKRPRKAFGNAIVTSAVLTENNAKRPVSSKKIQQSAGTKRRRTTSPPPENKKTKMINTKRGDSKLYCVCKTPYDSTKFYIGCDLCMNWFHGTCVDIPEQQAKFMSEWVCEDCQKVKEEPAQELYCLCRTPYDDSKFYIGCDICQDWYHGECVGILQAEADNIEFYTCPRCKNKKQGPNSALKENLLHSEDHVELTKIVRYLRGHKMAWPFLQPVSKFEVPSYHKIIKKPMDFGTVLTKLPSYTMLSELMGDVSLIFDNCRMFNGADSALAKCAEIVESVFVGKIREYRSRRKSM